MPLIDVSLPEGSTAPPILNASMVCRSTQNSGSTSTGPPPSVNSGRQMPGSLLNHPEGSVIDISSANPRQRGYIPPAGSGLGGYFQQFASVLCTPV